MALLAAPVAGALGTATYDNLTDRFAADRLNRQEVTATATDDSILAPRAYEEPFLTPIRWQFAGNDYTEEVRTYRMKAGEQLTIWIDTEGNRTKKPLTDENAATEAVVTAFGLWFATVGVAAAAWTMSADPAQSIALRRLGPRTRRPRRQRRPDEPQRLAPSPNL